MQASDAIITIIDFESTGSVDGLPDEPWQVGLVRFEQGRENAHDGLIGLEGHRAHIPPRFPLFISD